MRIEVVEEAQAQFAYRDEWWRANRDAQELFVDEYERALVLRAFWGAKREHGPEL